MSDYVQALSDELREKVHQESLLIGELSRLEMEDSRAVIDSPEFFNYKRKRDLLQSNIQEVRQKIDYLREEIRKNEFSTLNENIDDAASSDNAVELARVAAEEAERQRQHEAAETEKQRDHQMQMKLVELEIAKANAEAAKAATGNLDDIFKGMTGDDQTKD